MTQKPLLLVIGGPTASGKSTLAMKISEAISVEIVSADSMQIYRYMDIGTAKPGEKDRSLVPHHMVDIRDPDESFSVGDYVDLARSAVRDVSSRGRLPVMVGGTGLYIRGALGGIFSGPSRDPELRSRLLALEEREKGALYRLLEREDPVSAGRIHGSDTVRIIRALEVRELTGSTISSLQDEHRFSERPFRAEIVCLDPVREELYRWIDERVEEMIRKGLLDEVRSLAESGYERELNSMKGLGYSELMSHLAGEMTFDEAVASIKKNTRRYAKRQLTWFKSEGDVQWEPVKGRAQLDDIAGDIVKRLEGRTDLYRQ